MKPSKYEGLRHWWTIQAFRFWHGIQTRAFYLSNYIAEASGKQALAVLEKYNKESK